MKQHCKPKHSITCSFDKINAVWCLRDEENGLKIAGELAGHSFLSHI